MPFKNRIRLPMQLHSPQFPEERNIFRKANGETKTLSVIVRKTFELETDYMPQEWHQKLKIALAHDTISWEGERYLGDISQDGDYNIEWLDNILRYPTAKAAAKVQATPFDATNANCQTCDDVSQLSLEDDEAVGIYGALQEDHDYTVDTADNDNICCYPAVFSLVSYNSDYLTSASINASTGVLSIHTGTGLVSANGMVIARYRVTCPDGNYDEADVIADIDGTVEGCLAPTNTEASGVTQSLANLEWDQPEPNGVYYYELYEGTGPIGSPVHSGTTGVDVNTVSFNDLDPNTAYYFQVRTVCYGSNSNFDSTTFTTPAAEASCGSYQITNSDTAPPGFKIIGYVNCAGATTTATVFNLSSTIVCALETSPGDPQFLSSTDPHITITYLGPC